MAIVALAAQAVQQELKNLGLYTGTIDGALGDQSRAALRAAAANPAQAAKLKTVIVNARDSGVPISRATAQLFAQVEKAANENVASDAVTPAADAKVEAPAAPIAETTVQTAPVAPANENAPVPANENVPAAAAEPVAPVAPAVTADPVAPAAAAPVAPAPAKSSAYKVEKGDTVGKIAAAWVKANPDSKMKASEVSDFIIKENGIKDKSGKDCSGKNSKYAHIQVDQTLKVPEGNAIAGVEKSAAVCPVTPKKDKTVAPAPAADAPEAPKASAKPKAPVPAKQMSVRPAGLPADVCAIVERGFHTLAGTQARVEINHERHTSGKAPLTDPQRGNQKDCAEVLARTHKVKAGLEEAHKGKTEIRKVLTHTTSFGDFRSNPDRTIDGVRQTGGDGRPDVQEMVAKKPEFKKVGTHHFLLPESPPLIDPSKSVKEQMTDPRLKIGTVQTCGTKTGKTVQVVGLPWETSGNGEVGTPGATPGGGGGGRGAVCGTGGGPTGRGL